MYLSKATDAQILQMIESRGPIGPDSPLTYHGTIANTFYVTIYAGKENPAPGLPEVLEHLTDYPKLGIELYYWKPQPPKEEIEMPPIEIGGYRFIFNTRCFPHIAIDPSNDPQFKDQSWSKHFRRHVTGVGYRADLDIHTVCNILRYCDRMARLKMFW